MTRKQQLAEIIRALAKFPASELEAVAAELEAQDAEPEPDESAPRGPRRIERAAVEATLRKKGFRLAQ